MSTRVETASENVRGLSHSSEARDLAFYQCAATAPGKVILFGEHAINRGQPALAAAVGLLARCTVTVPRPNEVQEWKTPNNQRHILFRSGSRSSRCTRVDLESLGRQVNAWRNSDDFEAIRALKAQDFFAPQKYLLASALRSDIPDGLEIEWESEVPSSSGLGSGAAAFTSFVGAFSALCETGGVCGVSLTLAQRVELAHRGDIIAHGGVASSLDAQTSLFGGVIHYSGQGLAQPIKVAPGLTFVIGHTGVGAPTSEINARVRRWLEEMPAVRIKYFEPIGALVRAALPCLEAGNWPELGRLMTLNQLVLEKIGVSCPESDRLIAAALGAGALGAKVSGSGGGGIIIALVLPGQTQPVADAITAVGGKALVPAIGVPGVTINTCMDHANASRPT
jgi:mevalonate kinase